MRGLGIADEAAYARQMTTKNEKESSAMNSNRGTAGGQLATIDDPILSDETLWQVVSSGDLKGLSPKQKSDYYLYRCRQEGLNPASQPFQYITFQGKEILYAGKGAADQLRKLHGISITAVDCRDDGEVIECEVRVRDREGREDFEIGTVFVGTAKGVDRANAKMKCLSKAKRRATYSICGTAVLDETEVETTSPAAPLVLPNNPPQMVAEVVDQSTGEITAPQLNLNDDIRRLREDLGWTAQDVMDEAARMRPPANLKTQQGKQAIADRLQEYVDAVAQEREPAQDSFIDAESRPAGEPGLDARTA